MTADMQKKMVERLIEKVGDADSIVLTGEDANFTRKALTRLNLSMNGFIVHTRQADPGTVILQRFPQRHDKSSSDDKAQAQVCNNPERRDKNIRISGTDQDGCSVEFECSLVEGSITENGHCRIF